VAREPLRPGFGKPVAIEKEWVARALTEAARLNASKTPDVDDSTAEELVARLNEEVDREVDYD
jgi:hypothetical protein